MDSSTISLFLTLSFIAATAAGQKQNFPQDFMRAHNNIRAQVGVGAIKWSPTVADYALRYAQRRTNDCRLVNSGGPYGENQAIVQGSSAAWIAMTIWVSEMTSYNYASNSCIGGPCRNYTQVVWRDSTQLGCALQQCSNGLVFAICCYNPPGNIAGQRPY